MAGVKTEVTALLQGLQTEYPRLHRLLELLSNDLQAVQNELHPIVAQTGGGFLTPQAIPLEPNNFFAELLPDFVKFSWEPGDENNRTYEIREYIGTLPAVWNTSFFVLRTTSLTAFINPISTGNHVYLIKSINRDNIYSSLFVQLDVTIPAIGVIVIVPQVIDNTVLLRWNTPTSPFRIIEYQVYKDGVLFGVNTGNFIAIFEVAGGTFEYGIVAVDIAGNTSELFVIVVTVSQPPDFELFTLLDGATFFKTDAHDLVTNVTIDLYGTNQQSGQPSIEYRYLLPVDIAITYENHFITPGWATIQAQIDAGFPIVIQPTISGKGTLRKKWNLGTIISNIIANLDYTYEVIAGTPALAVKIEWSTDNTVWSSPVSGTQAFLPAAQWIRVTFEVDSVDTISLARIAGVYVHLDVKRENDGGVIAAVSTDATGTTVTFNKLFRDIDTVTGTALITEGAVVVIDFVDAPNPTTFKVLVFDYAGNRLSCPVRWAARGII